MIKRIKSDLNSYSGSISDYCRRINTMLMNISRLSPRELDFETLYESADWNIGFPSIDEYFVSKGYKNLLNINFCSEYELIHNIYFYSRIIVEKMSDIGYYTELQSKVNIYLKASRKTLNELNYDIYLSDSHDIIVERIDEKEYKTDNAKEYHSEYYNFEAYLDLKLKRDILRRLFTELEPIKKDREFIQSNRLVTKTLDSALVIFDKMGVRHTVSTSDIQSLSNDYNIDIEGFQDTDYHSYYDYCFNIALTLLDYYSTN